MMSASFAIFGSLAAVFLAGLSHVAVKQAERTGRARFMFWYIRGWGERSIDPSFFDRVLKFQQARTLFPGLIALVLVGYFLEAVVALN